MEIIKVTASEVSQVAPLFNEYRVFYHQKSDLDLAVSFVHDRVSKNQSLMLLAVDDNADGLGFTQLYPSFSSVSAKSIWILNDLFVIPAQRGKGIGKALLNAAKDFALSTNAKGLSLETTKDNFNAQKLYESLGYKRDHEYYHYFLNLEV